MAEANNPGTAVRGQGPSDGTAVTVRKFSVAVCSAVPSVVADECGQQIEFAPRGAEFAPS